MEAGWKRFLLYRLTKMKTTHFEPRGLVFDCDGTLADTMPLHWRAWNMVTGSMALNCYALPCVPHNLDFVIALRPADAEIVFRLFSPDYDISREAVDSAIAQQSFFNLFHRKSRIKVNCIVCQQINYRLMEYSRRQRVKFENFKTWIVSKEDLIISKLHWARKSRSSRHLRDVKNLAATGCDTIYIERWTRALGIFKLREEWSQG